MVCDDDTGPGAAAVPWPRLLKEDGVETAEVPTRTELVRRATALAPLLRAHADRTERHRRLSDEVIDALADAGLFRMRVPVRYGGFESDARTMLEVATALGQGDGSASWTASVWWITNWMAALFPDEVQDEVFAGPDTRVCGTLSPTAMAAPAEGGVVVNGRWGFISGALHSQWQLVVAVLATAEGGHEPIMAVAPMSDLRVVDDWHTSGLRGTGSVTTIAEDLFIPSERVMSLGAMLHEQYGTKLNADAAIYRAPVLPTASASSVGTVIGLARAAYAAFFERLPDRRITYTSYNGQAEAPLTHLQVADAELTIDAAEFHARRLAELLDAKNATGAAWTLEERARARADMGRACQLAQRAVDTLRRASGGSSVYTSVPIQRIDRDVQAINLHALMHPDTNLELYGRVRCGLEPNTLYL